MLRLFLLFCVVGFVLFACKKKGTTEVVQSVDNTDSIVVKEAPVTGNCYLAVSGNDSVIMQVVIENNSAIGQLHYRYFEKDKSGGTLFGVMRGDTLVADYKFMAEGTESEREVAFLKLGDDFIEGYGEVLDKEGRKVFKDARVLKFEGWPMKPTDCASLSRYFKK